MGSSNKDWIDLLSGDYLPSKEKVIIVGKFRKTLQIKKEYWSTYFSDFGGIDFKQGDEIEIISKKEGGNKAKLPEWVMNQLGFDQNDAICITEREKKFYIKKLELDERPIQVPGCIVVDEFGNNVVKRTYSNFTDIDKINLFDLNQLLSEMGRFRYDPLAPFQRMDGKIGFLARKEFLGGFTKEDKDAIRVYKREITESQQENGSWDENVIKTAFNLIRLIEVESTMQDSAVEKSAKWLLSIPEPIGLPGLFMLSENLVNRFNKWKEKPGAKGRPHRRATKSEMQNFLNNMDFVTNCANDACELRLTWTSAIVLEALLRCGLENETRVVRAINTLFSLSGSGGWCGCGYLDAKVAISESTEPVDFNRAPVPQRNAQHSIDWFADKDEILNLVCNHNYQGFEIGERKALWVKFFHNTGLCSMVVNRALSYHPQYHGSNLETIAALRCSYCQSSYGTWGTEVYLSSMFGFLERFVNPLSAFLILRSIPLLIREQRPDGFWQEKPMINEGNKNFPLPTKEESTFMILKALKRFNFLDALCPG